MAESPTPDHGEEIDTEHEAGPDRAGEVAYDLAEWSGEARAMVRQLVTGEEIPSAWEGTTLVVPAAFEERVDLLVDEAAATEEQITFGADSELVAFDVDALSDAEYASLYELLEREALYFELDELGRLLVGEDDVEAINGFLASIGRDVAGAAAEIGGYPDATAVLAGDPVGRGDDADDAGTAGTPGDVTIGDETIEGPVLLDTLGEVFVACDRLAKHPTDAAAVLRFADGAAVLARAALPFGFERRTWTGILGAVRDLLDDLEADDVVPDAEVAERARVVRDLLRPHV